jgi:type IV pilus assembly protein PilC
MSGDVEEPVPPRGSKPPQNPTRAPAGRGPEETTEPGSTWQPAQASRPTKKGSGRSGAGEPPPVSGGPTWTERLLFGSVSTAHLATFCRQFAAYLSAGVDLMRSLTSLEKQFARTALGPVIGRLQLAVRRGDALAEAMGRERAAFDPLLLSMIRVAEARGGVPETMRRMAEHYEARLRLYRQARSAMIYPVIVLLVAAAVVALLTIFILPMIVGLLTEIAGRSGADSLPLPTRFLMSFSKFVQYVGWWAIPLGFVVGFFVLVRAYKTPAGRGAMDEAALYVPVLGKLMTKIDTTRFARTLAALLDGGVDIGASLDLTGDVLHLTPFRRALQGARTAVMEGTELSEALRASGRFGPDVVAIVNSGEETGKLPETLERLADDYEEQVTYMVKNLGHLIQPLIMIALGGVVLFIILAVLLPYISMITSLAK